MTSPNVYYSGKLEKPASLAKSPYAQEDGSIKVRCAAYKTGRGKGTMQLSIYAQHANNGAPLTLMRIKEFDCAEKQQAQKPRLQIMLDMLRALYPQFNFVSTTTGIT